VNLQHARAWAADRIAEGHTSDGCTMPRWLRQVLRADNVQACCITHDMLRRFKPIPPAEADKLLRECIRAQGRPVLAWCYWSAVVLARRLGFYL